MLEEEEERPEIVFDRIGYAVPKCCGRCALARSECVYIRKGRPAAAANLSQIYSIYKRNVGETYMLCAVGICAIGNSSSSVTMTN